MSIFISHSREDQGFATKLASHLAEKGVKAVLFGSDVQSGSKWLDTMKAKIASADSFLLVMPERSSANSNNAFFEMGIARALGKKVVIVVPDLEEVDQSNIPVEVANTVVIDAAKQPLNAVAATVLGAVDQ
jgi:hypothetical protein